MFNWKLSVIDLKLGKRREDVSDNIEMFQFEDLFLFNDLMEKIYFLLFSYVKKQGYLFFIIDVIFCLSFYFIKY